MQKGCSRLITFRVTDEEYRNLLLASEARGSRSISEFVRCSVIWIVANSDRRLGDLVYPPEESAWRKEFATHGEGTRGSDSAAQGTAASQAIGALKELSGRIESLVTLFAQAHSNAEPAPQSEERALDAAPGLSTVAKLAQQERRNA